MHYTERAADPSADRFDHWLTLIAVSYGVFIVYGSLVPLDPRSLEWEEALRRFSQIPYLSLGVLRRADWVANLLLYIPLAFLWCARVNISTRSGVRATATAAVLICCIALAVVVEFFQLWFPPRTVSQNDLLAESLGSLIGVAVWLVGGRRLIGLARMIAQGGQTGLEAAFFAYAGLYFIYAVFPFDFLVSGQELGNKLSSNAIALIVAPSCGGLLRCSMKLTLEAASFMPFGVFAAWWWKRSGAGSSNLWTGLFLGAFIGVAIEGIQIFIASGITQGISVGTRAFGMLLGIVIGRAWSATWLTAWLPLARGMILTGVFGYCLLLAAIAWRGGWQLDGAAMRLGAVNWLPFYYHYYTTEQAALISLMRNAILYAPIGIAIWTWRFAALDGRRVDVSGASLALWLGAVFPLLVEFSKLFKSSGHADPTNIIIGAVAAWLGFHLTAWFAGCLMGEANPEAAPEPRRFLR